MRSDGDSIKILSQFVHKILVGIPGSKKREDTFIAFLMTKFPTQESLKPLVKNAAALSALDIHIEQTQSDFAVNRTSIDEEKPLDEVFTTTTIVYNPKGSRETSVYFLWKEWSPDRTMESKPLSLPAIPKSWKVRLQDILP